MIILICILIVALGLLYNSLESRTKRLEESAMTDRAAAGNDKVQLVGAVQSIGTALQSYSQTVTQAVNQLSSRITELESAQPVDIPTDVAALPEIQALNEMATSMSNQAQEISGRLALLGNSGKIEVFTPVPENPTIPESSPVDESSGGEGEQAGELQEGEMLPTVPNPSNFETGAEESQPESDQNQDVVDGSSNTDSGNWDRQF
jgi:hypothetical protein